MSQIARQYFLDNPLLDAPIVALLVFLAVFVAVTVAAMRIDRAKVDSLSRMPLDQGKDQ